MTLRQSAEAQRPLVVVVDDDKDVREALAGLFKSVGIRVALHESAQSFLTTPLPEDASCIILDIRLPGGSGLDLQDTLAMSNNAVPIILITGYGDIPMTVRGMKAGAVDFLTKPFRDQEMLDAVSTAIERHAVDRAANSRLIELRDLFGSLTAREKEIFERVTTGLMNKQIAAEYGVSEITVKIHRGRVMKKMGAASLADLVRMAELLGVHQTGGVR